MLLPCRPCCKALPADPCCTTGQLPDTVTVTFEGPQGTKTQGPSLLGLAFSACYGSGAEGTATAPGGDTDSDWTPLTTGPISAVALTKAGSGYAQFGREAPTLTLANSSTTPGTVTISLSQHQDDCGIDYWSVASISVAGGEGYVDGDPLTLTAAEGDTVQQEATGIMKASAPTPTLTASASPGTGATFTVNMKANNEPYNSTPMYGVDSVDVSGSTSGYEDGSAVSFSAGDAVVHRPAVAVIRTIRVEPTISLSVLAFDGGAGADITPNLTKTVDDQGRDAWTISTFTINNGGSNYIVGDIVQATVVDGQQTGGDVSLRVGSVNGTGAITSVDREVDYGGRYFKSSGTIERVEVRTIMVGFEPVTGGRYYLNGVFGPVISDGGKYYRVNESLPPYVADVSVSVLQGWPGGGGSGAVITATVNDDAESADFGKIQSVQRVSGGNGYFGFLWQYSCDCDYVYGEPAGTNYSIVAYRNAPWDYFNRPGDRCSYTGYRCWSRGTAPSVGLIALQITSPMRVESFEPFISSPFPHVVAPAGKPGFHNGPIAEFNRDINSLARQGFPFALPGRVQITPDKLYPGGHNITCAMTRQLAPDGVRPYWEVTSVTVTGWITGIANGDAVTLLVNEYEYGPEGMRFDDFSGPNENDAGPLPLRRVARGTAVVNANGIMTGVTLTDRGVFYLRTSRAPALVSPVTATIFQALPSQGSGAQFTVTVNADTASNGFGEIALNLVSGGGNYLSNVYGYDLVTVQYNGPNSPPTVTTLCGVTDSYSASAVYTSDRLIPDCSGMSFDAYFGQSKISVAPGGNVTPIFQGNNKCCNKCHVQCNEKVTQVAVTFSLTAKQGKAIRVEDQKAEDPDAPGEFIDLKFNFTDLGEKTYLRAIGINGAPTSGINPANGFGNLNQELNMVGWPLLADSFEINCPGDSHEVVFDIEDIMYSDDGLYFFELDGTWRPCWSAEIARSVTATNDPLEREGWWPSEADWPDPQNAAFFRVSEDAGGYFLVSLFAQSPSSQVPTVIISDGRGFVTYTAKKQNSADKYFTCAGFPESWEARNNVPDVVNGGYYVPPAHESKYTGLLGAVVPGFTTPRGFGNYGYQFVGRRICDQYEITVDIQT